MPNLFISSFNSLHFIQRFRKFTPAMVPNAKTMPLMAVNWILYKWIWQRLFSQQLLVTMNIDLATAAFIANTGYYP